MTLSETQKQFVRGKNFGHLSTTNADGSPQVTPVWVDVDGDHVTFNTEKNRLKTRNIERDPRISLCISDANDPYNYLEVRGRVVEMTEEGAFAHIDALAKKYMGVEKYPLHSDGDVRLIVRIEPSKLSGRVT